MTKTEYIDKWRGIYAKKNKHIQILSKRLCEATETAKRQAILNWMTRIEVEAQTINVMLLELENEVK